MLRQVRMWILDQHMPHLLLGNSLLKILDINVQAQLEKLAGKDIECSKFKLDPSNQANLSRLASVQRADQRTEHSRGAKVADCLKAMVAPALEEELNPTHKDRLNTLLLKYSCVFKLRLGEESKIL